MRRFDWAWLVLWGLLSSAWCLSASRELSAVFDEPVNCRWGLHWWRTGSNDEMMREGTMPLPIYAEYLPAYLWEKQRGEPFDPAADLHTVLPSARAVNLVFWWLLLLYGMLTGRAFAGEWAGRFAVVLLATEPNFLGHASLAMTDISVTAMVLAFTYHYYRGRDCGWLRRWFLPGMLYGVAMAAKASALSYVPIIMLAFEIPRLWAAGAFLKRPGSSRIGHLWRSTRGIRWDGIKILIVGMVVVWTFCGSDWHTQKSFVKYADNLPEGDWKKPTAEWAAHNLKVFPNAGESFAYQIKHNIRGHGSAILGKWYPRSVWYYFPVAMSIKLTLPVLASLALLLLIRPRSFFTPIALAALFLVIFTMNCRVQIGIRLVFPVIAILIVSIAVAYARATGNVNNRSRFIALGVLSFVCAIPALSVWPDGLRYGNELWGGTESTYQHLSDSNYDWGQGVYDLDRWTAEHDLPTAHVWYYGKDPIITADPGRKLELHFKKIESPEQTLEFVRGKVVAVSTTLLYGIHDISPGMENAIAFLRLQQPVGRSHTFFVFDFRNVP
jgi:hypothetical protein